MTFGPSALEELGDRMVPGHRRGKVGDWVVRADRGVTGRANSCWASGPVERDFEPDIREVERWYRAREFPALFQVFAGNDPLVEALVDRGYSERPGAVLMTASEVGVAPHTPGLSWTVSRTIPSSLIELVGDEDRVLECTRARSSLRVVTGELDGVVAVGGLVVVDGWAAGIGLIHTAGSHRRRGLATGILGRLVAEARTGGAARFWLQVSPDNRRAVDLYHRAGFRIEHGYSYYAAPEPAAAI